MRRAAAAALALAALAPSARADEARFEVPLALAPLVIAGEHSGLQVAVRHDERRALVTSQLSVGAFPFAPPYPLEGRADCPDAGALAVPPGLFEPPAEVVRAVRDARSAFDVLTAVVAFASERITRDDRDEGPQDALAVLRRLRGRCSGRANAAVGLLRVVGVPARTVHGLLVSDTGARWHRWGEAWLGPLGWVPFDPGASVGLVRVRYLPMRDSRDDLPVEGVRLLAVREEGFAALPRVRSLRVRPVGGATLHCVSAREGWLVASLRGPDGTTLVRQGGGRVVFPALLPGQYTLTWHGPGAGSGSKRLRIDAPHELRIDVDVQDGS